MDYLDEVFFKFYKKLFNKDLHKQTEHSSLVFWVSLDEDSFVGKIHKEIFTRPTGDIVLIKTIKRKTMKSLAKSVNNYLEVNYLL